MTAAVARAFVRDHPSPASSPPPPVTADALAVLRAAGFPRLPAGASDREARERAARQRAAAACDISGGL